MDNIWLLATTLLVAVSLGFWLKASQGSIRSAKPHKNFASEFSKFGLLGRSATLIQFSTDFCANCPGSKKILKEISSQMSDVEFIEIDAEKNLGLTKKLNILSTPTILIIDSQGDELARVSGKPHKKSIENFLLSKVVSPLEKKTA
jgi:thiol-disulfide isomerase/thioredoxin